MAANEDESGSWWSTWITTAKEKSISALSATTRDLAEFVNIVQQDTTSVVNDAATKVRKLINTEDGEEQQTTKDSTEIQSTRNTNEAQTSGDTNTYDRNQAQLESIRGDPTTYSSIPEGHSADFLQWSSNFELSNQQEEVSRLLVASTNIRKLHSELVPASVSYESFWYHYFYRVHLLEEAEAKRAEIMARVYSQGQLICWDEEEETGETDGTKKITDKHTDSNEIVREMTDSSESFVCISDEGTEDNEHKTDLDTQERNEEKSEEKNEEKSSTTLDGNKNESDSDWEKWDD